MTLFLRVLVFTINQIKFHRNPRRYDSNIEIIARKRISKERCRHVADTRKYLLKHGRIAKIAQMPDNVGKIATW